MNFSNIPGEMRQFRQWILWRMEWRADDPNHASKPTKIPYQPRPGGYKASVTNASHWGSFDEAISAPFCEAGKIWNHDDPLTEFNGIGFVFTDNDPYTGIDLDDTHGDEEAFARQFKIFREFNSYSELSPSGNGLHVIVKGSIPGGGRRRAAIEVYCRERYFTMTGNVQNPAPIEERQELLTLLHEQMGGKAEEYQYADEKAETMSDADVVAMARGASNGDKFSALYDGDWKPLYQGDQSRADYALIDILAFYSRNKAQITRIFLNSQLGQRDKARDRPGYVAFMVAKSFDNQLPPIDIDGWRVAFQTEVDRVIAEDNAAVYDMGGAGAAAEIGKKTTAAPGHPEAADGVPDDGPSSHGSLVPPTPVVFPPGLVGEVASFILSVSPRPVPQIALAAAVGLLSGIMGRAYNVSGTGLNQYVLMLAMTGVGKDAVSVGISKLMYAVRQTVPSAQDFQGPGELVSSAGLIKWLADKPAVVSVLGEFGVKLKEMASPHANAHLSGVERVLLQMYSKSGKGNVFDPMAYSDREKNTLALASPSLTILAESVPERFYEMLDEAMIASGLLPRFMIYEYTGKREYLRKGTEHVQPSFSLVQQMCDLCAQCLTLAHNQAVHNVPLTPDAQILFDKFDRWTTDEINGDATEVKAQLWNRAHLKALKLAAVIAVGINYLNPIITVDEAEYATAEIVKQTTRLLNKFADGEVGSASSSAEVKQRAEIYKVIARYSNTDFEANKKYGGSEDMHGAGVILDGHIQRRVISMACFRNDKFGASNAIKRALAYMLQNDELRELPSSQTYERFGTKAKAYIVANPQPFVEALRKDEAKKAG